MRDNQTRGKLLPLEQLATDGVESNMAQSNTFLNNVVNVAVKGSAVASAYSNSVFFFCTPPVRSANSFILDIRVCSKKSSKRLIVLNEVCVCSRDF